MALQPVTSGSGAATAMEQDPVPGPSRGPEVVNDTHFDLAATLYSPTKFSRSGDMFREVINGQFVHALVMDALADAVEDYVTALNADAMCLPSIRRMLGCEILNSISINDESTATYDLVYKLASGPNFTQKSYRRSTLRTKFEEKMKEFRLDPKSKGLRALAHTMQAAWVESRSFMNSCRSASNIGKNNANLFVFTQGVSNRGTDRTSGLAASGSLAVFQNVCGKHTSLFKKREDLDNIPRINMNKALKSQIATLESEIRVLERSIRNTCNIALRRLPKENDNVRRLFSALSNTRAEREEMMQLMAVGTKHAACPMMETHPLIVPLDIFIALGRKTDVSYVDMEGAMRYNEYAEKMKTRSIQGGIRALMLDMICYLRLGDQCIGTINSCIKKHKGSNSYEAMSEAAMLTTWAEVPLPWFISRVDDITMPEVCMIVRYPERQRIDQSMVVTDGMSRFTSGRLADGCTYNGLGEIMMTYNRTKAGVSSVKDTIDFLSRANVIVAPNKRGKLLMVRPGNADVDYPPFTHGTISFMAADQTVKNDAYQRRQQYRAQNNTGETRAGIKRRRAD